MLSSRCKLSLALPRPSTTQLSIAAVAKIERSLEDFLKEISLPLEGTNGMSKILSFNVDIIDGTVVSAESDSVWSLDSSVDILYQTEGDSPLHLDNVLSIAVRSRNISFATLDILYQTQVVSPSHLEHVVSDDIQLGTATFSFKPVDDDTSIFYRGADLESGSSNSIGFIVAVIFLSLIVVLVSSVLLHITGGWKVCQQAVTNFLFEEVDEDDDQHYLARSKANIQVQPTHSEDDDGEEDDEESLETGTLQTNPSGILGSRPATDGLGIVTNGNGPHGLYGYNNAEVDEESRLTEASGNQQLGIASIRKMPQNNEDRERSGLTQMIMHRFNKDEK